MPDNIFVNILCETLSPKGASKSGIDLANSSRTRVSADINLGRTETEEIAVKTKQQITSEQAVIAMVTKGRC